MSTEFDDGDAVDTTSKGPLVFGSTGVPGIAHPLKLDADGNLAAVPLPTGAATEATLASIVKEEDSAAANQDKGVPILAVRRDSMAGPYTSAAGDYAQFGVDEDGALWARFKGQQLEGEIYEGFPMQIGGVSYADNRVYEFSVNNATGAMQVDVSAELPAGTQVIGIVNQQGAASGDFLEPKTTDFDTGGGTDSVTSFGIAVPASGGAAIVTGDVTNGLDVDVTRSALPTGAATSANQDTTNTALSNIQVAVQVMDDWDDGSDHCRVVGSVAHDAADSGNPTKTGARAVSSLASATMVAAADRVDSVAELDGASLVRPQCPLGDILQNGGQTLTATTSTAVTNLGAGGAGVRNYISSVSIWNYSAVDTYIKLQDGSGGTQFWVFPAPALGGCVINFTTPLKQPTANTALYMAEGATANGIIVSVQGFQSKI